MISELDSTPWYRQFWPWFIIALPASVVIAGFITLFIAITHRDSLVKDNYYKEGLAINADLREIKLAKELGLKASIFTDTENKTIAVQLDSEKSFPSSEMLLLKFIHPFEERFDIEIPLQQFGTTHTYQQSYYNIEVLDWNLEISPLYIETQGKKTAQWKIITRFNPSEAVFTVDYQ